MSIIYMNYYSKPRTREEAIREKGKIVTKVMHSEEFDFWNTKDFTIIQPVEWTLGYRFDMNLLDSIPDNRDRYTSWQIPKHSGGFRTINAPNEHLMELQKTLLKRIYKGGFIASNSAHGFVKHRNCKTALEVHQKNKSRWFLKIDIHDAFGSTTAQMIYDAMHKVHPFVHMSDTVKCEVINTCTLNRALPQGAPTSPTLLNMVLTPFDYKLNKYCNEHKLTYTRYADDIIISSRTDWDWNGTYAKVETLLGNIGYTISEHKTHYGSFNGRNWNCGLMYNNAYEITVGHQRKHILKCRVHNFLQNPTWEEKYRLIGELGYVTYIEPENERFKNLLDTVKTVVITPVDVTTQPTQEVEEDAQIPF